MKIKFTALVALLTINLSLFTSPAKADEGMWVIGNISQKTDSLLHSLGLEISSEELYSADHPSLNNAIIQLGGFCSGSIVSDQGLVFTNHHCGFDAIQNHSSVKHDYLKNGFFAKTLKDELPNEGLFVLLHLKTIDVTDRVLDIPDSIQGDKRTALIGYNADQITEAVNLNNEGIFGEINPFYKGSKFFLSVYQRYDDVRLVAAPPQCLGKYGGDTDNWMWPRQTCDFSVFRIYAGKDNRPAKYSPDNVPFRPRQYAHISVQGIKEGDFSMTLGYPGSTDRYLSSYGIWNTMRCVNDVRYQVRSVKLDIMKKAMASSDALRIMYASKQASSSNYWKFSLGQNTALDNLKVLDEKRATEAKIQQWINSLPAGNKYVGILDSLKIKYEQSFNAMKTACLFSESFLQGSDILRFVIRSNMYEMYSGPTSKPFATKVKDTYKDIDVETDKAIFAALLKNYIKEAPEKQYLPAELMARIDSISGGDIDAFANQLYSKSIFAKPDELAKVNTFMDVVNDPMVEVATDIIQLMIGLSRDFGTEEYERLLGDALREMNHEKDFYPDANFTMRLSYGLCQPINFAPGTTGLKEEATSLITTPRSFLNKYENASTPEEKLDFELIDPVYKWMKKGKFSPQYIDKNTGTLPLCFLTTNDITGGNSGSGMYNGKGQLIGLAFDGNWEAMSGDLKFDTNLQRCIGVDIRWVLSVLDDYLKAKRLINELTIE